MSDLLKHPDPVISPRASVAETTVLSIGLGIVLAIVLSAANIYLGLYIGMTVSASIPAAVVSMAILRGVFRRGTILENNIAQTIASTGESLAAGAIFTIPALVLVGAWQNFEYWPTTFITMLGGLLGVIFMVPLRRALIVQRPDLMYPEGVACSKVLIAGQEGGSGARFIALGLLVGGTFKYLITGMQLFKSSVEGAMAIGGRVFYAGADMSMALVAVGYIIRMQIAVQVFLGGVIGWLICIPVFGYGGDAAPLDSAWDLWDNEVRYVGVGAMLVGGLTSIWSVRHGIFGALSNLGAVNRGASVRRTERDISTAVLAVLFVLTAVGTAALYRFLIGDMLSAMTAAGIMIVAAFVFVAVATYIVGMVGSSNSPVSGMTICTVLLTAAVLTGLGIEGDSAILATLGVAGVVCCAACTSGDIAQDLKTGLLVGATPARQQWTELIGVIVPAFFFAPILVLLHNAYTIGSEQLLAPQATLFMSLTQAFFGDGELPWDRVALGMAIGVLIVAADAIFLRTNTSARAMIMPIAVGLYLPFSLGATIFLGGLIRWIVDAGRGPGSDQRDSGVLLGSGLIAGEALMGIALAGFLTLEATMGGEAEWVRWLTYPVTYNVSAPVWVTVAAFGIILALFGFAARRFQA